MEIFYKNIKIVGHLLRNIIEILIYATIVCGVFYFFINETQIISFNDKTTMVIVPALISAIIALIIARRKEYKEIITRERVRWISELRKCLCEVITSAYALNDAVIDGDSARCVKKRAELRKFADMATLMVKPNNKFNYILEKFVDDFCSREDKCFMYYKGLDSETPLDKRNEDMKIEIPIKTFKTQCQKYLKKEWESTKQEALF